jgi:hypothetical protein
MTSASLLVATVAAVGVLHTMVPDHWAPVAVVARSQGWSRLQTARAAALAGAGHVTSTLLLGLLAWSAGMLAAAHYASLVNRISAFALIAFGLWIAYAGWREAVASRDNELHGHAHRHRHSDGIEHVHWHQHDERTWHVANGGTITMHEHAHSISRRAALLLILGSSPMVEGLPAFFAASSHGGALVGTMAVVFAVSTIGTYVVLSTAALGGFERLALGKLERYGEALSGAVVACVGVVALFT